MNSKIIKLIFTIPLVFANWPMVFFDYLGLYKNGRWLLKIRHGLKLWVRSGRGDIFSICDIFIYKAYEERLSDVVVREKDVVLDIGAGIGDFSLFASKKAKKIFAYEPTKCSFDLLKHNVDLNNLNNKIKIFNMAVGAFSSDRYLLKSASGDTSNSLFKIKGRESENALEKVKVIGINDIFRKKRISGADFVKIDAEGAEYEIVYNMDKRILKKAHCVVIEIHDCFELNKDYKPSKLVSYIKSLGFDLARKKDNLYFFNKI